MERGGGGGDRKKYGKDDPVNAKVPPPARPQPQRRRARYPAGGPVVNQWVRIDVSGKSAVIAVDRHKLTQELGVQLRDLRLLDPKSCVNPSAILPRDRALVVALENIKAVITQNYVLVMNPEGDGVAPFVRELESRLVKSASFPILTDLAMLRTNGNGLKTNDGSSGNGCVQEPQLVCPLPPAIPFELRALEVSLESVRNGRNLVTTCFCWALIASFVLHSFGCNNSSNEHCDCVLPSRGHWIDEASDRSFLLSGVAVWKL